MLDKDPSLRTLPLQKEKRRTPSARLSSQNLENGKGVNVPMEVLHPIMKYYSDKRMDNFVNPHNHSWSCNANRAFLDPPHIGNLI